MKSLKFGIAIVIALFAVLLVAQPAMAENNNCSETAFNACTGACQTAYGSGYVSLCKVQWSAPCYGNLEQCGSPKLLVRCNCTPIYVASAWVASGQVPLMCEANEGTHVETTNGNVVTDMCIQELGDAPPLE